MTRAALLFCSLAVGCVSTPEPPQEPTEAEVQPLPPRYGASEHPPDLPPAGPDFPTHHLADAVAQALLDHFEGSDTEASGRAMRWAEHLAVELAPQYRYAHQLHAYTQRVARGPVYEQHVTRTMPGWEPAAYRYFFDRSRPEVADLLRCNLVASCTWREGREGFRKAGGAPFELVQLGDAPAEPSSSIKCGSWELDPATCPADFPVFERTSWLEMGRDRLDLWSTEHTPLTMDLLVRELGIEPGMRVADVGAGAGWFAFPFAEATGPTGEVLAVDLDPVFVDYVNAVAQGSEMPMLKGVLSQGSTPELPPGELDLVWVALVFQDLYLEDLQAGTEPSQGATMAFAEALTAGLKPGGRLAVVEIGPRANGTGADIQTGFELEGLWALLEAAGFEPERQVPTVIHAELRTFTKPVPQ